MKKLFSFILIISMMLGTVAYATGLTDINKTHWAYNDIQLGIEKGFFSCYPDGSFKPERNLTRAEAIKVITEFLGRTVAKPTESEFTDLDVNSWYAPYIHVSDFLFPEKWIDEKLIKADKPITREEVVYALVTAMRYDYKKADADLSLLKGFKDKEKIGFGLEPYMALAAASFNTDMDSTSLGLISDILPSYGIPSTMIRGELPALMDPTPRIRIVGASEAGSPEEDMTCTPGAVPARAEVTSVVTLASISSELTIEAEPVNEFLVAVPYATTIVSSIYSASGMSATSWTPLEATGTLEDM